MLSVANLTRRFGERVVLDRISFTVTAGEVCAVIGSNGSGKTTLLRCVVGADRTDGGQVRLDGRPMTETDPVVRASVACVLDDVDFFPDLSVGEHLDLLAYAHGGREPGAVEEVIAELGLADARDQLPATLSSGQRRRLALASCFVRPRRLLVLDEPEQRLDVEGREWLTRALLREREAGTAVLLASHDADLVAAVADSHLELGSAD
ncbi:MAG TPA: heme ABC exporter ATP-binding protein CcmA [Rugosimonospora sp.]|jgi:heme ABC exporter ATP-binding subunit CcmA